MTDITAVVLAAGEGKRMRTLGANLSKVMLPILGKPVLAYIINNIKEAGIRHIVIVISGHLGESLTSYFGSSYKGMELKYVYQNKQLGPAHAISLALPEVDTDFFLVQYGDSLADQNIPKSLVETLNENPQTDGVLAVRQIDNPSRYGIVKYNKKNIVAVVEKPSKEKAPSKHAVIGTFILKTDTCKKALKNKKFEYGKELFPAQYLLATGAKMIGWFFDGSRVDVGKPQDLFNASQLLAKTEVECIVFDADNTLYNTHQVAKIADLEAIKILAQVSNQLPISLYEEWQEIVKKIKWSKNPRIRSRPYSYGKLCQKYHQNVKLAQKMFATFTKTLLKNLKVASGIKQTLEELPQEKFVVTEDISQLAAKKLNHLKIDKYFKEVITSDKVKIMKPSKKYYETILREYQPQEILAVGDDWQKDLKIPSELGMQIFFVENEKSLEKFLTINLSKEPKRIHLMGIAGVGAAAVAGIASAYGYEVSGCDLNPDSPYTKNLEVRIKKGHSPSHLSDIDLLITSPAVEKLDPNNGELKEAKRLKIPTMTWQEFQGKYLQKNKFVITVAGAYGKSTTTAMIAQILIDSGLDPTCEIGAKVLEWGNNFKIGKSKYYVCESDEYNNNFLNYYPDIAVVLNVAWDHPDFFKNQQAVIDSYRKFLNNIKAGGTLVLGSDPNLSQLTKSKKTAIRVKNFVPIKLSIIGDFRKENANAALTVAQAMGIDIKKAQKSIENFKGLGRRLEYKGQIEGVKFYDDYAVQPYTIQKTADALKAKFKDKKVALVLEPHTFSRIETFFKDFVGRLKNTKVDRVLITNVYAAREHGDNTKLAFKLVQSVGTKAKYIGSLENATGYVKSHIKEFDVVLSMGAGDIYKLYDLIRD